jgi:hypothetical protein
MDLQLVRLLLIDETRMTMASLINHVPISNKAQALHDLSRLFQAVGICQLLVDASIEKFYENLVRSAHARRYHLWRSRSESSKTDHLLGISRVEAVFDAYVANRLDLIRDIDALSTDKWHLGWEYEDDFVYYIFMHRVLVQNNFLSTSECNDLLFQFERSLEGGQSLRLDMCVALRDRDTTALRATLQLFLQQRQMTLDKRRDELTEYTADAIFWPQSFVCIEALAWLKLTQSLGMSVGDGFLFCPSEALSVSSSQMHVEDLFESLDEALAEPES